MQCEVILQKESSSNQRIFMLSDDDSWSEAVRGKGYVPVSSELERILNELVDVGVRQSWMRFAR